MSGAMYLSPAQRIGRFRGKILKHSLAVTTLDISGEVFREPVGQGDTVTYRQVVPYGATTSNPDVFTVTANSHLLQEGATPAAESLSVIDTTVSVSKYGCLYTYTEKTATFGEDDVPAWMEEQIGERLGLVREKIYIAALQQCTNKFYSGGTTRGTTDEPVTLNLVNRITRNLAGNHAKFVRGVMTASPNYGSQSVQATYLAFGHTALQQDIEAIPGYKAKSDYGQMKPVHEMEIGCVGSIRFILSPEMPYVADSGAAISGTTNYSTSGTSADVYQLFVIAKDAWAHLAFRGKDAVKTNHIKPSQVDKSDPTGERGYVSGTFYDAAFVSHPNWMAVAEVTISSLTS